MNRESVNTTGVYVENAVLKWLESEYPNDKITRSAFDSSSVDFFRLTEYQSRIGYEIKFIRRFSRTQALQYVRNLMSHYYSYKNLSKVYLILVFDAHISESELVKDILTNMISSSPQNNLGLIIGMVTLESNTDETLEFIFKPLHFVN